MIARIKQLVSETSHIIGFLAIAAAGYLLNFPEAMTVCLILSVFFGVSYLLSKI